MHWSQEEAENRDLSPTIANAMSWAVDANYSQLENCLREALSTENLRISMLKHEKARILREMREALAARGYQQAIPAIDRALENLQKRTPQQIPAYYSRDL